MADQPMTNVYEGDPAVLVYRAMNETEQAQRQADQTDALARARDTKTAEILAALAATDQWVARAWEDGLTALPEARGAYRDQLRELLLQVETSTDPAAIEIPPAPVWVPATTS